MAMSRTIKQVVETSGSTNSTAVVGEISSEMMQQLGNSLFERDSVRGEDADDSEELKDNLS